MIDRLRQMAIFAKCIDHGSFRGAAKELRLSPSVVSHHVSQLEEHLGVALLYRSTRKLALTPEGTRLLAATRKMLEAVEGELQALSGAAEEPSGELRITLPSVLSQSFVSERLAVFSQAHPRIHLELDFSDARRALIEGGFDLAIRMGPDAKTSATSRKLAKVARRLMVAESYLDGRELPTHPKDLQDWDWLALTPVQNVPFAFSRSDGTRAVVKPAPKLFANDAQAVYRLARAGAGVAVLPEYLAAEDVAAGRMAWLLPDWQADPVDVYAVWPANAPKHGLVHLALAALSDG
ncbi:MAG: LysR substrate-binding domain-containing protein [Silicimonas sp.]|nr:LysR substrate-binding domain-containing protein [Silicimonas sp.]